MAVLFQKPFIFSNAEHAVYKREEKKEIARKAIALLEDGMIVILGGGTTMIEMARLIPKGLFCTFLPLAR